jgi:hypothetical protein
MKARHYRAWTSVPGTPRKRIVQRFYGAAGHSEYIFDTDLFQISNEEVSRIHGVRSYCESWFFMTFNLAFFCH